MDSQPSYFRVWVWLRWGFWTVLRVYFRHVRRPRAFHIIEQCRILVFLRAWKHTYSSKMGRVSDKVSTADAAGGERVGLSGLLVRHTPMLFVIA